MSPKWAQMGPNGPNMGPNGHGRSIVPAKGCALSSARVSLEAAVKVVVEIATGSAAAITVNTEMTRKW